MPLIAGVTRARFLHSDADTAYHARRAVDEVRARQNAAKIIAELVETEGCGHIFEILFWVIYIFHIWHFKW